MADPFRGEICAAWLDFLAELEPPALQQVMEMVADGQFLREDLDPGAQAAVERTTSVYLPDLLYANDHENYPEHALTDQPGAM